jgi:hypothetical protein
MGGFVPGFLFLSWNMECQYKPMGGFVPGFLFLSWNIANVVHQLIGKWAGLKATELTTINSGHTYFVVAISLEIILKEQELFSQCL